MLQSLHPLLPGRSEQQVQAGQRGAAGQRIAHEGRAVHEQARVALADDPAHLGCSERRGQTHVAAGQGLAQAHDVGRNRCVLAGEQPAGAAKTGGDFVQYQQHAVLVAQPPRLAHIIGAVEVHSACSLHHRLHNQRRGFVAHPLQRLLEHGDVGGFAGFAEATARPVDKVLPRQHP